ncbi:MAG: WYL domain-containing protein [Colwellia sp.]|jgi:hypothetical protein
MNDLSVQVQKRLKLIDLYLAFTGSIQRSDLINHFDIGVATASRTLKLYRSAYPQNIEYSISDRTYITAVTFNPAFQHSAVKALSLLAYGEVTHQIEMHKFGAPPNFRLAAGLEFDVVRAITTAMVLKSAITINYTSADSGEKTHVICPHCLFESGGSWYFRAYLLHKDRFTTFRFSRVTSATSSTEVIDNKIFIESDTDWYQEVVLTIGPHPNREKKDALREDLGLVDKPVVNIKTNAVLVGYLLTEMRVDSSENGSMNSDEYYLRLLNRHELIDINGMFIAPGFR